jgi:hypothetical protein
MNFGAYWLLFAISVAVTLANHIETDINRSVGIFLATRQPPAASLSPWLFQALDLAVLGMFIVVPRQSTTGLGMKLLLGYQIIHTLFMLLLFDLSSDTLVYLSVSMCAARLVMALALYGEYFKQSEHYDAALFVALLQFVVLWDFVTVVSFATALTRTDTFVVGVFVIAVCPLLFFMIMLYVMALDLLVLLLNVRRWWHTAQVTIVSGHDWTDFFKYGGITYTLPIYTPPSLPPPAVAPRAPPPPPRTKKYSKPL